jgi:hypothetical protein
VKTFFYTSIVIISIFSAAQAQTATNKTIKILQSSAVTIDGKIEETEWKDASQFELAGGGKVYFQYDGEYLSVGVLGIKNGWSHLYLNRGEKSEIAVLHASAALGMTLYNRDKNKLWQPSNPFSWDLRDTTIAPETTKKMADYLAKNFWVANNNSMGNPTEIEFRVKARKASDKTFYVAVVYAADAKNPRYFPATLKDDTLKEDLIYGNTPNDLEFDRNQWAKIIVKGVKTKK